MLQQAGAPSGSFAERSQSHEGIQDLGPERLVQSSQSAFFEIEFGCLVWYHHFMHHVDSELQKPCAMDIGAEYQVCTEDQDKLVDALWYGASDTKHPSILVRSLDSDCLSLR
eukprot:symbB.v1.2.025973.t1/scaffold2560.1/size76387/5